MKFNRQFCWYLRVFIGFLLIRLMINNGSCLAEITTDLTLGDENSMVDSNATVKDLPASLIEGGAARGINLFHSFSKFNIGNLERVYFANPTGIERIFSRVTGNNISNIEGLLGVVGNADLFLLNPNGIIFGENASLDVNGSFIGTTADSLVFGDEFNFSADRPASVPSLLTLNIVPGLQYGSNSGAISNFSVANDVGLQVPTGETLALIAGDIELNGGIISAFGGRVELGSIGENSLVKIEVVDNGYTFNYDAVEQFQDISFISALVELSGDGGGDLQLRGKQVSLREFSQINSKTLGGESGGLLDIKATESIKLSDSLILGDVNQGASGDGGVINIETKQLTVIDGGLISVGTFGSGDGGDLKITTDELEISGSTVDGAFPSELSALVAPDANADGGNLIIETESLTIANGARVSVGVFGRGNAGNLNITAQEIEIVGETFDGRFGSTLDAQVNSSGIGNGGNLNINTETLKVAEGAQIAVSIFGRGNAGNSNITAKEIEIVGTSPNSIFSSGLFADVGRSAIGKGGSIVVETDRLTVADGGEISASVSGEGDGGSITITASEIEVIGTRPNGNFSSGLFAQVNSSSPSGNGGSIILETNNLTVANGAQISVGTGSQGNGGNLEIQATKIEIIGESADGRIGSGLFSQVNNPLAVGNSGNLTIETEIIKVAEGAQISVNTFGLGNAGILSVTAKEVEITSRSRDNIFASGLFSVSNGVGNGGEIKVTTEQLSILDGGEISASSLEEGLAGNVEIKTNEINLNDSAITTKTDAGDGGDITLQINDLLLLRNESEISTSAGQIEAGGDGGDITIDSDVIVAFPQEDSDITANAFNGSGGNIEIDTEGIFGIEFRDEQTSFSDITASSEFGLDGSVTINTPDVNPAEGLIDLPQNFIAPPLDSSCQGVGAEENSSFVDLGRGGMPENPQQIRENRQIWDDLRSPVEDNSRELNNQIRSTENQSLVEAQGWVVGENGNILLVANNNLSAINNYALHCKQK